MSVSLTTAQVIYSAQSRLLELADAVEVSASFKRVKDKIQTAEALIRYIRVLQSDTSLTLDEQVAICQHMITIGNLYNFPASPTITTNETFNYSAGTSVGPQGIQGVAGRDGGGTDYNQFALTTTTTVDTFAVTDADGAEWSYKIKNGANLRAGRITAVWLSDGTAVNFAEYSTLDIGTTAPLTFSVVYSAGNIILRATITSGSWNVNGTRYYIPNNGASVRIQSTALATGKIFIGDSTNVAAAQTVSGDISLNSSGVAAITAGVITNGDIASSATIDYSKLAVLTTDRALVSSSVGVVAVSTISTTKLGYLTDVTSNIQAQLDTKLSAASGAISTVVSSNLTASKVTVSNSAGKIAASTVSTTELDYLLGTTSTIQTQINNRLQLTGGSMTGFLIGTTLEMTGGIRTFSTGPYLKTTVINIGDWDIVTSISKNVAHGIVLSRIRDVTFIIRNDADTLYLPNNSLYGAQNTPRTLEVNATNVVLSGTTALQTVDFDATSYNRGWITIIHEA